MANAAAYRHSPSRGHHSRNLPRRYSCDFVALLIICATLISGGLIMRDVTRSEPANTRPLPRSLRHAAPPADAERCAASRGTAYWNRAHFTTTRGTFVVQLRPDLAPRGVAHFEAMATAGYFDGGDIAFFRVNGAITQFGADEINARPQFATARSFSEMEKDDNPCGALRWAIGTFALLGGNQLLIVIQPNDHMGHNAKDAPAGYVVSGMETLNRLHKPVDIIDNPQGGEGPDQGKLQGRGGKAYLKSTFPNLDWIKSVRIERGERGN